ncbi:MAG: HEAT repeat domain-containing protein [Kiritimatiellae bacterium]|nr:HEAT repeat domain-containing protein [Kiritimatiellia bacterium]
MTESKSRGIWLMLVSGVVVAVMGVAYFMMAPQQPENEQNSNADTAESHAGSETDASVILIAQSATSAISEADKMPMDKRVAAAVDWFKNCELGPNRYAIKVKSLSAFSDEMSVRVLMVLSDDPKSSVSAVQALGSVRSPDMKKEIIDHLRKQAQSRNINVQSAALESFARVGGDDVLKEMERYITNNWRRPDGRGERVCTAVIKGVADVDSQASLEMLRRQLQRVGDQDWLPDYGSVVVWAISKHHHPQKKDALLGYADGMSYRLRNVTNRSGQNYLKEKIKQAIDAAAALDKQPDVGAAFMPPLGHGHNP